MRVGTTGRSVLVLSPGFSKSPGPAPTPPTKDLPTLLTKINGMVLHLKICQICHACSWRPVSKRADLNPFRLASPRSMVLQEAASCVERRQNARSGRAVPPSSRPHVLWSTLSPHPSSLHLTPPHCTLPPPPPPPPPPHASAPHPSAPCRTSPHRCRRRHRHRRTAPRRAAMCTVIPS